MLKPFQLAFASLKDQHSSGSRASRITSFRSVRRALLLQVAQPLVDAQSHSALVAAEAKRLGEQAKFLQEAQGRAAKWAEDESKGSLSEPDRAARADDKRKREELDPAWLVWKNAAADNPLLAAPEEEKARAKYRREPRRERRPADSRPLRQRNANAVSGSAEDRRGPGALCRRGIEKGNPTWTTLRKTNAVLLFDRILRGMIESTLPHRTHEGLDQLTIPLASFDPNVVYSLHRPLAPEERGLTKVTTETAGGEKAATDAELLDVGIIGPEQRGLTLHHLLARGVYRVVGERRDPSAEASMEAPVLDLEIAINGPADESSLAYLTRDGFEDRTAGSKLRWVGPDETIRLGGRSAARAGPVVVCRPGRAPVPAGGNDDPRLADAGRAGECGEGRAIRMSRPRESGVIGFRGD